MPHESRALPLSTGRRTAREGGRPAHAREKNGRTGKAQPGAESRQAPPPKRKLGPTASLPQALCQRAATHADKMRVKSVISQLDPWFQ